MKPSSKPAVDVRRAARAGGYLHEAAYKVQDQLITRPNGWLGPLTCSCVSPAIHHTSCFGCACLGCSCACTSHSYFFSASRASTRAFASYLHVAIEDARVVSTSMFDAYFERTLKPHFIIVLYLTLKIMTVAFRRPYIHSPWFLLEASSPAKAVLPSVPPIQTAPERMPLPEPKFERPSRYSCFSAVKWGTTCGVHDEVMTLQGSVLVLMRLLPCSRSQRSTFQRANSSSSYFIDLRDR